MKADVLKPSSDAIDSGKEQYQVKYLQEQNYLLTNQIEQLRQENESLRATLMKIHALSSQGQ